MKTPGLLATTHNNYICLEHPNPDLARSIDDNDGDTKDLHELCEDLDRRDFLLKCIYTDETDPLSNFGDKKVLTYDILNEYFPSILHYTGECTAPYCILSRNVDPIVRPAIEEIYTAQILKYMANRENGVLDIAIYGYGGFLIELLILTRVVRKLKLKEIRLHLINETMGELYNHVKCVVDDSDNDRYRRLVNISDIIDNSDPQLFNRKTNYFRYEYAKLCAISEWFTATEFTACKIYIFKDFAAMSTLQYDVFMGIDFIEEFISRSRMSDIQYTSMITSDLILLAHKYRNEFMHQAYQYARVSVINNTHDETKLAEIKNINNDINKQIVDINDRIKSSAKLCRPVSIKDNEYVFGGIIFSGNYVELLSIDETDESLIERLSNGSTKLLKSPGPKRCIANRVCLIYDDKLECELEDLINMYADNISDEFNNMDVKLYDSGVMYLYVLRSKSLVNAIKMILESICATFISTLICICLIIEWVFRKIRFLLSRKPSYCNMNDPNNQMCYPSFDGLNDISDEIGDVSDEIGDELIE